MSDPWESALGLYLEQKHSLYRGKLEELREAVQRWLAYIPATFPHYTRHTIEHSDEIVSNMSHLLFCDGDPAQPVIRLSAIEAYILCAAAYLHDSGMVAADAEKEQILQSAAWKEWVTGSGGAARRWREIEEFRHGSVPSDGGQRNFIADRQVRFLIAEHIRRLHHLRAADVVQQHQTALGRFAFDDPMLAETIGDVCVAHGLRTHELQDEERYPDRRSIRGETVSVRFMALLLRLGDLLDMSSDRACPLLLNAACPLPVDSFAHWSQYQRIRHRLIAPDRIEIRAECQDQEEHRVLQDWCQWIVDEVGSVRALMARAVRHAEWKPPHASFEAPDVSIIIRPAVGASYIPSRWVFQFDQDAVFERLIHDVYPHRLACVRELLQNAFDATRCRLYLEAQADGLPVPESPTQFDEERRSRYPVRVTLERRARTNELSGESEDRYVLTVVDNGIGMDRGIVEQYFLQVGRSYYRSEEFRRRFGFVPTSRFGIGFLSVFAVSNRVVVDTFKRSSNEKDNRLRLTLTGPKSYLLLDKGTRVASGTSIELWLAEAIEPGELTNLCQQWCTRVEFPIEVNDLGAETRIVAETKADFEYEIPDVTKMGATFVMRSFPVARAGLEGEFFVFCRRDEKGESWAARSWADYTYPTLHPAAHKPPSVESVTCFQGMTVGDALMIRFGSPVALRVDYRGRDFGPTLGRESRHGRLRRGGVEDDPVLASRLEELVAEHVATTPLAIGEAGWQYKQRLVTAIPVARWWRTQPGMIRMYERGVERLVSLEEAEALEVIRVLWSARWGDRHWRAENKVEVGQTARGLGVFALAEHALVGDDLISLSEEHRQALFSGRLAVTVERASGEFVLLTWRKGETGDELLPVEYERIIGLASFPAGRGVGMRVHLTTHSTYECVLANRADPFVQWIMQVKGACREGRCGLREAQFSQLMKLVDTPVRYGGSELRALNRYLDGWRSIAGLPPELLPPEGELRREMFTLNWDEQDSEAR